VIHALKVEPDAVAASSIALASSGGNDTDRLSRCAITKIVAQAVGQRSGRTTSVRAARQTPGRAASDLAKSLQLVPFRRIPASMEKATRGTTGGRDRCQPTGSLRANQCFGRGAVTSRHGACSRGGVRLRARTRGWLPRLCSGAAGLPTQGDDLEEATANAEEALALYVEGLREEGRPLEMGVVRRRLRLPA